MTTIIAVEKLDQVLIVGDTQASIGSGRFFDGPEMEKVAARAEFLIGAAGNGPRPDSAMMFLPPPPTITPPIRYMREEFVPALRQHFESQGLPAVGTEDGLELIVCYQGRAFQIDGDGVVFVHPHGRYGVGSGAPYALGALAAGALPLDAMLIAHNHDPNTGSPGKVWRQQRPRHA